MVSTVENFAQQNARKDQYRQHFYSISLNDWGEGIHTVLIPVADYTLGE